MSAHATKQNVVVIVGPTASGKTSLSIAVAKEFGGEVISADSRQVYRGLDVGSGKVTMEEMDGVPHHLLDVADPMEVYTAADFVRDGRESITNITERGKLPIIAGGTFFYIDALLGRVHAPGVSPNPELRERLETMSTDALYTVLLRNDPRRATDIDPHNKRRLVRALEVVEALGRVPERSPRELYRALTIGLDTPKKQLHKHIHKRLIDRIEHQGMIEEVEQLHARGVPYQRLEELGLEYRYTARFLQGHLTKEDMIEMIDSKSRQFAKRQMTWLKGDKSIQWFGPQDTESVFKAVERFLSTSV